MIQLPAHPAQDNPNSRLPEDRGGMWDLVDECAVKSAIQLHETLAAKELELQETLEHVRDTHATGKPCDFLEILARIRGTAEEHIGEALLQLSSRMAAPMHPYMPVIPFAGKLISPNAFYDAYEPLHMLAKGLLTPVLYAEDTDAIGVGSINPVAAAMMAQHIASTVKARVGIQPFVCQVRLDYETWSFLTRKHFEV
jgi:hypothetical protein